LPAAHIVLTKDRQLTPAFHLHKGVPAAEALMKVLQCDSFGAGFIVSEPDTNSPNPIKGMMKLAIPTNFKAEAF
jgi:hypothetical protein